MLDFYHPTILSIKRPGADLAPFEVDLKLAYVGEQKMQEIATASSGNALHLASVFSRAYDSLGRAYGGLINEAGRATVAARKRRSILVLDKAVAIAKEKGLSSARSPSGSEDVREAICYADDEYCAIEEYRASIDAAKELVFCKLQAMRMSWDSVRSLVRGTGGPNGAAVGNSVSRTSPDGPSLLDEAFDRVEAAENNIPAAALVVNPPAKPETNSPAPRARGFGTPIHRE